MTAEDAFPEGGGRLRVDASAPRGSAHPLRGRIRDELVRNGSATAAILGGRLEESGGATSHHLRRPSRYGFVDAVPGRSGGRERWWRIRPGGWNTAGHAFMEDPRTRPAAGAVLNRYHRMRHENFQDRLGPIRELPDAPDARDRKDAATDAQMHLRLTPGRPRSSPPRSTRSRAST